MSFKEKIKQIAEDVGLASGILKQVDEKGRRINKKVEEPAPRVNPYSYQGGPYRRRITSRGVSITPKRPRISR